MSLGMADLLRKYKETQTKFELSTRCGTLRNQTGTVKDVFNDFFLFITVDDRFSDAPAIRHWIMLDNIAVMVEEPKVKNAEADVEILR